MTTPLSLADLVKELHDDSSVNLFGILEEKVRGQQKTQAIVQAKQHSKQNLQDGLDSSQGQDSEKLNNSNSVDSQIDESDQIDSKRTKRPRSEGDSLKNQDEIQSDPNLQSQPKKRKTIADHLEQVYGKPLEQYENELEAERAQRKQDYTKTAKDISSWQSIVSLNRQADHLKFGENTQENIKTFNTTLAEFKPRSGMESEIASVLSSSGLIQQEKELAKNRKEKAKQRQEAKKQRLKKKFIVNQEDLGIVPDDLGFSQLKPVKSSNPLQTGIPQLNADNVDDEEEDTPQIHHDDLVETASGFLNHYDDVDQDDLPAKKHQNIYRQSKSSQPTHHPVSKQQKRKRRRKKKTSLNDNNNSNTTSSPKLEITPQETNIFVGDDNDVLFAQMKQSDRQQQFEEIAETQEINPLSLPGWGKWSTHDNSSDFDVVKMKQQQVGKIRRTDDKIDHVILYQNSHSKHKNYKINKAPHSFGDKDQFRAAMKQSIGQEWNPVSVFRQLVGEKVTVSQGQIVEPLKLSKNNARKRNKKLYGKKLL